jgi:hypothetical protein
MIGAIVKFKNIETHGTAYPEFQGKVGYVLSYSPKGDDGHPHVRVRWFQAIPHPNGAPRNVSYSDFRLERFEILSKPDA